MASPPIISGLPAGLSLVNVAAPPYNLLIEDANAEVLRKDVLYRPTGSIQGTIVGVRINNTQNPNAKVWLKMWDSDDPVVGTEAPPVILRCRAGKITEYYVLVPFKYLSYQVLVTPGTKGTTAPTKPVSVCLAIRA